MPTDHYRRRDAQVMKIMLMLGRPRIGIADIARCDGREMARTFKTVTVRPQEAERGPRLRTSS